jgi:hypothetical protein
VYELGVRDFGENYVQELTRKQTELRDLEDLRWHLIGPLQRNKVKQLVGSPPLIHTLDNERLGDEIERRFGEAGKKCGVLVEVNLGDETQKAGCAVDALPGLLARAKAWEHVDVRGLMAIPPVTEDPEASRVHFRRLRELRGDYGSPGFELSMGMSHDFVQAIGEGATLIRVGTAIFGARAGL